jgi:hypothetical protein
LDGDSANYSGPFLEGQGSAGDVVGVSGSVFGWPGGSFGIKIGVFGGTHGISGLLEGYTRIWDCQEGWIPDIRNYARELRRRAEDIYQEGVNSLANQLLLR